MNKIKIVKLFNMYNKHIPILMAITLIMLTVFTGVAIADNALGDKNDSQPVLLLPKSAEEIQLEEELNKETETLMSEIKKGFASKKEELATIKAFIEKWKGPYRGSEPIVESLEPNNIIVTNTLDVSAYAQLYTNYCGPASAYQLLKYLGIGSDPRNPARSLTQGNLASDLRTDSTGTPFTGTWVLTLNGWTGTSRWYTYWAPSESTLWNKVYTDVSGGYPLIFDTHMNSTNGYLPGYSGSEWWHYVTGDGYQYDEYTLKRIHYVDPNNFRSGCFGPHWVDNWQMAKLVKDRGIVY